MADSEDSRERQRAYQRAYMRTWRAAHPEKIKEASRQSDARRKANRRLYTYTAHKNGARQRGIDFLLTFDEWWAIWDESGRWEQRGAHRGEYCMARHGDTGPYEIGNVRICKTEENHREYNNERRGKPASSARLAALNLARQSRWAKYRATWAKIRAACEEQ